MVTDKNIINVVLQRSGKPEPIAGTFRPVGQFHLVKKYGMIVLEKSRRKKISFGQSLNKQELETLFAEIEKKLKLPTPV